MSVQYLGWFGAGGIDEEELEETLQPYVRHDEPAPQIIVEQVGTPEEPVDAQYVETPEADAPDEHVPNLAWIRQYTLPLDQAHVDLIDDYQANHDDFLRQSALDDSGVGLIFSNGQVQVTGGGGVSPYLIQNLYKNDGNLGARLAFLKTGDDEAVFRPIDSDTRPVDLGTSGEKWNRFYCKTAYIDSLRGDAADDIIKQSDLDNVYVGLSLVNGQARIRGNIGDDPFLVQEIKKEDGSLAARTILYRDGDTKATFRPSGTSVAPLDLGSSTYPWDIFHCNTARIYSDDGIVFPGERAQIAAHSNHVYRGFTLRATNGIDTTLASLTFSQTGTGNGEFYPYSAYGGNMLLGRDTNRWGVVYGVDGNFSGTINAGALTGPAADGFVKQSDLDNSGVGLRFDDGQVRVQGNGGFAPYLLHTIYEDDGSLGARVKLEKVGSLKPTLRPMDSAIRPVDLGSTSERWDRFYCNTAYIDSLQGNARNWVEDQVASTSWQLRALISQNFGDTLPSYMLMSSTEGLPYGLQFRALKQAGSWVSFFLQSSSSSPEYLNFRGYARQMRRGSQGTDMSGDDHYPIYFADTLARNTASDVFLHNVKYLDTVEMTIYVSDYGDTFNFRDAPEMCILEVRILPMFFDHVVSGREYACTHGLYYKLTVVPATENAPRHITTI